MRPGLVHPARARGSPFGLAGLRVNPVVAAANNYSWVEGDAAGKVKGPRAELMLVVAARTDIQCGDSRIRGVKDDYHDAGSRQNSQ